MESHELFEAEQLTPSEARQVAASDLRAAIGWFVFGIAVLVGSITMDRLERQDINPYTVPGLLPGLLGIVITLLGVLLALRSWRRGGLGGERLHVDAAVVRRLALVIALLLIYSIGLVGRVPFWLASALYVARLDHHAAAAAASRARPRPVVARRRVRDRRRRRLRLGHHLRVPGPVPGAPALSRTRCRPHEQRADRASPGRTPELTC